MKSHPDSWGTLNAKALVGRSLASQNKHPEAEALLLEGYRGMIARESKIPFMGKKRITETLERLVQLKVWQTKLDERRTGTKDSAKP